MKKPNKSQMTPGQIGCLLSHLSVLCDAYQREYQHILVFEDDVEFLEPLADLSAYLQFLTLYDPDLNILFLDKWLCEEHGVYTPINLKDSSMSETIKRSREAVSSSGLSRVYYRHGMYSYIVSKKCLGKILKYFFNRNLGHSIDIEINHTPQIRMYETTKNFVKMSLSVSDTANPFIK